MPLTISAQILPDRELTASIVVVIDDVDVEIGRIVAGMESPPGLLAVIEAIQRAGVRRSGEVKSALFTVTRTLAWAFLSPASITGFGGPIACRRKSAELSVPRRAGSVVYRDGNGVTGRGRNRDDVAVADNDVHDLRGRRLSRANANGERPDKAYERLLRRRRRGVGLVEHVDIDGNGVVSRCRVRMAVDGAGSEYEPAALR